MAFNKAPQAWLGKGYALASSEIKFTTATSAGTSIGSIASIDDTLNIITLDTVHLLRPGSIVKFATNATLPGGLTAGVSYYVLSVPTAYSLTVSLSPGGAIVDLTSDAGSGTKTAVVLGVAGLTDAEANASSGDIRSLLFHLIDKLYHDYNAIAVADRPTKMQIFSGTTVDQVNGTTQTTYTFAFKTVTTTVEVADE